MPLVTPGMLAAARNLGNKGLESSAQVMRSTQIETDFGSEEAWVTVALDVPCWVREMGLSNSIIDVSRREAIVMVFRIHFEFGTDVHAADRLYIAGTRFDVIDDNDENTVKVFQTVTAKRVL